VARFNAPPAADNWDGVGSRSLSKPLEICGLGHGGTSLILHYVHKKPAQKGFSGPSLFRLEKADCAWQPWMVNLSMGSVSRSK